MAQQSTGDAPIEKHGIFSGDDLASVQTFYGALAGAPADVDWIGEIGGVNRRRVIVIALHRRAITGQHGNADAVAACLERAGETVRRDQSHAAAAPTGLGPFGIGNTRHGARRVFGRFCALDQRRGRRLDLIDEIEVGPMFCQLFRRRQTGIGVFRHRLGHVDGAGDQLREIVGVAFIGGNDGLALADEHAQAEIEMFRSFQFFGPAQPLRMAERGAFRQQRVGLIGAGRLGPRDEIAE